MALSTIDEIISAPEWKDPTSPGALSTDEQVEVLVAHMQAVKDEIDKEGLGHDVDLIEQIAGRYKRELEGISESSVARDTIIRKGEAGLGARFGSAARSAALGFMDVGRAIGTVGAVVTGQSDELAGDILELDPEAIAAKQQRDKEVGASIEEINRRKEDYKRIYQRMSANNFGLDPAEPLPQDIVERTRQAARLEAGLGGSTSDAAREARGGLGDILAPDPRFAEDTPQKIVDSIFRSVPGMLVAGSVGSLASSTIGRSLLTVATTGSLEGAEGFATVRREMRDLGYSDDEIHAASFATFLEQGATSGVLEALPIHRILGKLDDGGAFRKFLKNKASIAGISLGEITVSAGMEALTEFLQTVNGQRILAKHAPELEEELRGFGEEEGIATAAGGVIGGLAETVVQAMTRQRNRKSGGKVKDQLMAEILEFGAQDIDAIYFRDQDGRVQVGRKIGDELTGDAVSGDTEFVMVEAEVDGRIQPRGIRKEFLATEEDFREQQERDVTEREDREREALKQKQEAELQRRVESGETVLAPKGFVGQPTPKAPDLDVEQLDSDSQAEPGTVPEGFERRGDGNFYRQFKTAAEATRFRRENDLEGEATLEVLDGTDIYLAIPDIGQTDPAATQQQQEGPDQTELPLGDGAVDVNSISDQEIEESALSHPGVTKKDLWEVAQEEGADAFVKQRQKKRDIIQAILAGRKARQEATEATEQVGVEAFDEVTGQEANLGRFSREFPNREQAQAWVDANEANLQSHTIIEADPGGARLYIDPKPDASQAGRIEAQPKEPKTFPEPAGTEETGEPQITPSVMEDGGVDLNNLEEPELRARIKDIASAIGNRKGGKDFIRDVLERFENSPTPTDPDHPSHARRALLEKADAEIRAIEKILQTRGRPLRPSEIDHSRPDKILQVAEEESQRLTPPSPYIDNAKETRATLDHEQNANLDEDPDAQNMLDDFEAEVADTSISASIVTSIGRKTLGPTANTIWSKFKKQLSQIMGVPEEKINAPGKAKIVRAGQKNWGIVGTWNRHLSGRNVEEVVGGSAGQQIKTHREGIKAQLNSAFRKEAVEMKKHLQRFAKENPGSKVSMGRMVWLGLQDLAVATHISDEFIKQRVMNMRHILDANAGDIALLAPKSAETMYGGIGSWLTRAYLGFDSTSKWNFNYLVKHSNKGNENAQRVLDRAIEWFKRNEFIDDGDRGRIQGREKRLTEAEALTALEEFMDVDRGSIEETEKEQIQAINDINDGVPLPSMTKLRMRKNLPFELRAALGEITNPVAAAAYSLSFQAQLISMLEAQQAYADVWVRDGLIRTEEGKREDDIPLFDEETTPGKLSGFFRWSHQRVRGEDGETKSAWSRKAYYANRDMVKMVRAMVESVGREVTPQWAAAAAYQSFVSIMKSSKVAIALRAVPVNYFGAMWGTLWAGGNPLRMMAPLKWMNRRARMSWGDVNGSLILESEGFGNMKWDDKTIMDVARRANLIGQSVLGNELMIGRAETSLSLDSDLNPFRNVADAIVELYKNRTGKSVYHRFAKAWTSVGGVTVAKADESGRLETFIHHLAREIKAAQFAIKNAENGAKYRGEVITKMPDPMDIAEIAAQRTRRVYINYDRIPRMMRFLSSAGVIGTFTSFATDQVRVTVQGFLDAGETMAMGIRDNNAAEALYGARMLSQRGVMAYIAWQGVTALAALAVEFGKDLFEQLGLTEGDEEERERVRYLNTEESLLKFRRSGAMPFDSGKKLIILKASGPDNRKITYALPEYAIPLTALAGSLETEGPGGIVSFLSDTFLGFDLDRLEGPAGGARAVGGMLPNAFINVVGGHDELGHPLPRKWKHRVPVQLGKTFGPQVSREITNITGIPFGGKTTEITLGVHGARKRHDRVKDFDNVGLSTMEFFTPVRSRPIDLNDQLQFGVFRFKEGWNNLNSEIKKFNREGDTTAAEESEEDRNQWLEDYTTFIEDLMDIGNFSIEEVEAMEKKAAMPMDLRYVMRGRERKRGRKPKKGS